MGLARWMAAALVTALCWRMFLSENRYPLFRNMRYWRMF